jgi:hypothetical protein
MACSWLGPARFTRRSSCLAWLDGLRDGTPFVVETRRTWLAIACLACSGGLSAGEKSPVWRDLVGWRCLSRSARIGSSWREAVGLSTKHLSCRGGRHDGVIARLILINGAPGVGKSALARRFAREHSLALVVDIDLLRTQLGQWEAHEESKLAARNLAVALVEAHLTAGRDVLVPPCWAGWPSRGPRSCA